jgi:hypothetical protein
VAVCLGPSRLCCFFYIAGGLGKENGRWKGFSSRDCPRDRRNLWRRVKRGKEEKKKERQKPNKKTPGRKSSPSTALSFLSMLSVQGYGVPGTCLYSPHVFWTWIPPCSRAFFFPRSTWIRMGSDQLILPPPGPRATLSAGFFAVCLAFLLCVRLALPRACDLWALVQVPIPIRVMGTSCPGTYPLASPHPHSRHHHWLAMSWSSFSFSRACQDNSRPSSAMPSFTNTPRECGKETAPEAGGREDPRPWDGDPS